MKPAGLLWFPVMSLTKTVGGTFKSGVGRPVANSFGNPLAIEGNLDQKRLATQASCASSNVVYSAVNSVYTVGLGSLAQPLASY